MTTAGTNPYPGVAQAIRYAKAVRDGRVVAGVLVKLACKRFLTDLEAVANGTGPWDFDPDLAEWPMIFAGQLVNIKGPEAGKPLRLMDWQRFIFANVFGFVERDTRVRRFRQAVVYVPRGNGKTSIAAPIALYLTFVEKEGGAEGYAAAVTRDQARILFEMAQNMARRSPEFCAMYGVEVGAHTIFQTKSASKMSAVSSDAKALDGLNVQVAVLDEIASHKTSEVYDVLLTAMGKRTQPFMLSISTATGNTSGIGKQLWNYAVRVLEGVQEDERLFSLIYTIDEEDDPWDEATWIKANPSWGQAVQPDAIRGIMRQARNNPAQESAAKTRHLNVWVGADEALISVRSWRANADPELRLEDFEGQEAFLGLDLASKTDLAALSIVIPRRSGGSEPLEYVAFTRCYINEAAVLEARNASYPGWASAGYLTVTQGNETDFGTIEADILDLCRRFRVISVAYDPWGSIQLAQRLSAESVRMFEFRALTQNFSEPTKELDAATRAGRLRHDGNPVLEWCIGNLVGRYDARGNVYPKKERPENKIDAAVALIMCIGRAMVGDPSESIYAKRDMILL